MTSRLIILLALAAGCGVLVWTRARWQQGGVAAGGVVPAGLVPAGQTSWLVLTTPWCASCGPVVERLEADGELPVVVVDVAERPDVSRALDLRQAPTVLRVGPEGEVLERRNGAAPVRPLDVT
ncbi:hypothetical protein B7486_53615 [cyanobacterium TDX16]|nr:hypothetical protein B7486_53615 [cyanobacterium TDX16]